MKRDILYVASLLVCAVAGAGAVCGDPGTEFWAVLSDRAVLAFDLVLVVGNPDPTQSANVCVETESGVINTAVVPPGETAQLVLGNGRRASQSVLSPLAYRVRSDIPVFAMQAVPWDPLPGTQAYSMLLDRDVLGTDYLAITIPGLTPEIASVVTIVSPSDSRVEVAPTADVQAGTGVPAITAGTVADFSLKAFDVLQFATENAGGDLTGTMIRSDAPVAVFAGCPYCYIGSSAADNVQEAMIPVGWWGTEAYGVTSYPMTLDVNVWRVMASVDGTQVSTDPVKPGFPLVLDRGKFVEFTGNGDFRVSATAPILLTRLTTAGSTGFKGGSDPSMCLMLPPERFVKTALFALPNTWPSWYTNWVDMVAAPGTVIVVDGTPVPAGRFVPIGSSAYSHVQVELGLGSVTHTVTADQPIAIYAGNACFANAGTFPVDIAYPPNLPPLCDAGGPYTMACSGPRTAVQVSGAGSSDPESRSLQFRWSCSSPEVSFDDPALAQPTVTVSGLGAFVFDLEINDGAHVEPCTASLEVTGDTAIPPELARMGPPLWIEKRGADVLFSFEDVGGAPVGYNVYQGSIGAYEAHGPLSCGEAGRPAADGRREVVLTPGLGSFYFLVTASNCYAEGPSGADSAQDTCPP